MFFLLQRRFDSAEPFYGVFGQLKDVCLQNSTEMEKASKFMDQANMADYYHVYKKYIQMF